MYYITGDTHGNQTIWTNSIVKSLKPYDTIVVAGDFGIGFFNGKYLSEEFFLDYLSRQPITILFADGNHEDFNKLSSYPIRRWNNGNARFIRDNIIHLMRGEVYDIESKSVFVMGGGYSIDKDRRVLGESWWEEEMPSVDEYQYVLLNAIRNLWTGELIKLR